MLRSALNGMRCPVDNVPGRMRNARRDETLGGMTCPAEVHSVGVGIQVSCSAEDHSTVRDGRSPVSKYSRTSLYIAGHLPHLKAIKQPSHHIHHTF